MAKDYYEILGISRDATDQEIKKAFRRLANKYHPDKKGGDERKFKEINEAYQVLSDKQKRAQYDQFGSTFDYDATGAGSGFSGFTGGFDQEVKFDFSDLGGFSDIFSEFFGGKRRTRTGPKKGDDINIDLEIDFKDAVFGTEKTIELYKRNICSKCKGNGAEPGTKISNCQNCEGTGHIQTTRRSFFGQFTQVTTCPECDGEGKKPEDPCSKCGGDGRVREYKKIKVKIPAGIDQGQIIRIGGEGEAGLHGGSYGDLYITISVKKDDYFERDGYDVRTVVPISFAQAALGDEVEVTTLDGKVRLKIPAGTQSGKVFRLSGKGIKHLHSLDKGDHFVEVIVVTPKKLSRREKELFRELALEGGESVKIKKGFFEKIRRKFR